MKNHIRSRGQKSSVRVLWPIFCTQFFLSMVKYRKIPNISPGLIKVRKHFLGCLYSGGYIRGGLIFGGHFVLVSEYQELKIHC